MFPGGCQYVIWLKLSKAWVPAAYHWFTQGIYRPRGRGYSLNPHSLEFQPLASHLPPRWTPDPKLSDESPSLRISMVPWGGGQGQLGKREPLVAIEGGAAQERGEGRGEGQRRGEDWRRRRERERGGEKEARRWEGRGGEVLG